MAGRDRRTRYQGVFARHRTSCGVTDGGRCDCTPSYYGKVYDRAGRRYVSTKRFPTVTAARAARQKLVELMESGELPQAAPVRFRDAHTRFVEAARDGRVLNKHGRRYKPSAIKDIDECLRVHVAPVSAEGDSPTFAARTFKRSSTTSRRPCRAAVCGPS